MNTNLIFVTNIPKSQRPNHILKEIDNKWAKVIFIDNPHSELMDAFIYNPTLHVSHFDTTIAKLRTMEIDDTNPLKVFYVWFPPSNVVITTMIPHGSILLPYLIVDSIPKNIEEVDVIGDLPFKANDFKQWDIPYKEDKWMVLRLPTSQDETTRNYVLSYIRNKKLASGCFPRVSEIIVTEDSRLSRTMVPKHLKSLTNNVTFKSNLIFLYDLPAKMSSQSVIDALKQLDFRGCRVSLIDVIDTLRLGFIYTPNSFPEYKFRDLMERLKTMEIDLPALGLVKMNFSEVWLQPVNCLPPIVKERNSYSKSEFILTNYLYVHNLSLSVQPCDLRQRCPIPVIVQLYSIPDTKCQFGFITLQDITDAMIGKVLDYLRSLVCDGMSVLVDEIWIKEHDLPAVSERRPMLVSRNILFKSGVMISRAVESMDIMDGIRSDVDFKIRLADAPPMSSNLMKSSLVFLMNVPDILNGDAFFSDLVIPQNEVAIMESPTGRVGFLFHRQVSDSKWTDSLEKMCYAEIASQRLIVKEVYLQCDETIELIQQKLPAIYLSNYVFIYNIGGADNVSLTELHACTNIVRHCTMTTCHGAQCVIAQLCDELTPAMIMETLSAIRNTKIGDKMVYAELVWLANIDVFDAPAVELNVCRFQQQQPEKPKQVKRELV